MTRPNQGRRHASRIAENTKACQECASQVREDRDKVLEAVKKVQQATRAFEEAAETVKQYAGGFQASTTSGKAPGLATLAHDASQVQARLLWLEQENRDLKQQLASKDAVFTLFVEKLGYDTKRLAQEAATRKA